MAVASGAVGEAGLSFTSMDQTSEMSGAADDSDLLTAPEDGERVGAGVESEGCSVASPSHIARAVALLPRRMGEL